MPAGTFLDSIGQEQLDSLLSLADQGTLTSLGVCEATTSVSRVSVPSMTAGGELCLQYRLRAFSRMGWGPLGEPVSVLVLSRPRTQGLGALLVDMRELLSATGPGAQAGAEAEERRLRGLLTVPPSASDRRGLSSEDESTGGDDQADDWRDTASRTQPAGGDDWRDHSGDGAVDRGAQGAYLLPIAAGAKAETQPAETQPAGPDFEALLAKLSLASPLRS